MRHLHKVDDVFDLFGFRSVKRLSISAGFDACSRRDLLGRRRVVLLVGTAHYMVGRLAADEFVANRVRSGRKQP